MIKSTFRWEFGTCSFIVVYKDNIACAHFSYDDKLRFHVAWTASLLTEFEWDCILVCVKQAKMVLKKLKRI